MPDFSDLPHLRTLQKDLWTWPKSRAAVMVGAGLSLNAQPLPGVTSRFPTWRQLVKAMFIELHPPSPNENPSQRREREATFFLKSPLRIASEYEAAFDRRKLHLLIQEQNPDSDYQPGPLHKQLLQLPWADVFTTNYDTLLERTEVRGRAYQPVIRASELTTAFAPRIVKLHGSFPSQTPFIITEEDYRTYPRLFAPFVNSVRQSLLENSFVLLGFSGDDPNFLEWTGWIRDELGHDHAPIYLVGCLSLQPPQRALLTRRGVTPIDLNPLFEGAHFPQGIHAAALEWFLRSLAGARLPLAERWPSLPDTNQEIPADFPPVSIPDTQAPPDADLSPHQQVDLERVKVLFTRWRFDQKRYPGWLVLDNAKRMQLWTRTKYWIAPLFKFAESWSVADSLILFDSINWRLQTSLVPLFTDWVTQIEKTVGDAFPELISGNIPMCSILQTEAKHTATEVVDAWFSLAFAVLQEARETYKVQRWTALKGHIEELIRHHPRHMDRLKYEEALWALWNINPAAAKRILKAWQPSPALPLAAMWKAGLLAEVDELDESRITLRALLSEIRKGLRNRSNNVELLSLEGWCTYILAQVEEALNLHGHAALLQEFSDRWQELKAWDCSPWPYREYFEEALSKPGPRPHKSEVQVRGFDPGQVSSSLRWRDDDIKEYLPAFAFIRFFEKVGVPMRMRTFNMSEHLSDACQWIAPFIPFWSSALLIRAGRLEELKKSGILSRSSVASMDSARALKLYEWCLEVFEREVACVTGVIASGSPQETILETMPEVLSRLSVRADGMLLKRTFPVALRFHEEPGVRGHFSIHDSTEPWFQRLFEAADPNLLLEWLPQLLRSRLYEDSAHSLIPQVHAWPDPMRHFPSERVREANQRDPKLIEQIKDATNWLIRRAGSESGEARQRALSRLTDVFYAQLMNPSQAEELAQLLWSDKTKTGLPRLEGSAVFGFLHLPAPTGVDVPALIKGHILSLSEKGAIVRNAEGHLSISPLWMRHPLITEAAYASKPIVQLRGEALGGIEWTVDETKILFERAYRWWCNDKQFVEFTNIGAPFGAFGTAPIVNTLELLGCFFSRAVLPKMGWASEEDWTQIQDWMTELRTLGVFPTVALPYVLMYRSTETERCASIIEKDLNSDDSGAAGAAAEALRHWIHLAEIKRVPSLPGPLLTALVNRIAFRRHEGIVACLQQLSFLIIDLPQSLPEPLEKFLEDSLEPWQLATNLPMGCEGEGEFPEAERPELRVHLAKMAGALQLWRNKMTPNMPSVGSLRIWKELCLSDPLPEIRRAFDI